MKLKDSIIIILLVVIAIGIGVFVGVKLTENKYGNPPINNETTNDNQEQNNNKSENSNENNNNNQIKVDYSTDEKEDVIIKEGMEEVIKIKTYISSINLNVDYEHNSFIPRKINENSFIIKFIHDQSIYVKFELLNKTDYDKFYNAYKEYNYIVRNGYKTSYYFDNKNDKYYMITVNIVNDPEYGEGVAIDLGYIRKSMQIID